jgi:hypothetical protein
VVLVVEDVVVVVVKMEERGASEKALSLNR